MRSDVIIIGGGPAGSSAAIRLAQIGLSVRLYEITHFPRRKLCGGFLSPETLADLQQLGVLEELKKEAPLPVRRTVLSSPSGKMVEAPLPAPGLSLSREKLDMILLRKARACGVEVHEGTNGLPHQGEAPWTIFASGRKPHPVAAATPSSPDRRGRSLMGSSLSYQERAERSSGVRYYGIHAFFENVEGMTDQVELNLFPGGYVGLIQQDGARTNLCALATQAAMKQGGQDLDDILRAWTLKNPLLRKRLQQAARKTPWKAVGAVQLGYRRLSDDHCLFTGDAACVVDPFMGEGMAMGLRSSAFLQQAFRQGGPALGAVYERTWHNEFDMSLRWGGRLRWMMYNAQIQNLCVAGLKLYPPALTWLAEQTRPKVHAN